MNFSTLKVILCYTFACCQGRVQSVIKLVCNSSQRFANDAVEDACDAA